tara:strand:+ start:1030 stop:1734 length:705 start_codon:yes stop_codon:yes gene_type:complete
MKLPKQETPVFKVMLPVSQQEVSFRPFLVKEQKHLFLAREGKDSKEIFDAIQGLLSSVTEEKVNSADLAMADLEYLFLQIRCKSVGETTKVVLECNAEDCKETHIEEIDLSTVSVNTSQLPDNKIQISDELMIELKYPTTKVISEVAELSEAEAVKPILRDCMVRIYDEEEIYELKDFPDREIDNFIENMTIQQFEKVMTFFNSVPSLQEKVEWKCKKCENENLFILQGLQNFF